MEERAEEDFQHFQSVSEGNRLMNSHNTRTQNRGEKKPSRLGSILVLATGVLIMVFAFAAFSVDVGYITLTKTQLQNAVDAAALAAVMELDPNGDQTEVQARAIQAAKNIAGMHKAGDHSSVSLENNLGSVQFGRRTFNSISQKYTYVWGPEAEPYNLVKVTAHRKEIFNQGDLVADNQLPLFFAPVIGTESASLQTSAIATFQPRDIMLVLDYSASMNDDSELTARDSLGQEAVEENIQQIWEELGSPTYGNLDFTPDWVTIPGATIPTSVKWMTNDVEVITTESIDGVVLYFANGEQQSFGPTSQTTKTYSGSDSNSGQRITSVYVKTDDTWEEFNFYSNSHIRRGLGLNDVAYPYPSGSWNDYIEYARSHSSNMPWYEQSIFASGYRRKFGMLTLIDFWNKNKPMYSETPDLWKTSQQPITALKDSVDVLLNYLSDVSAEDNVGLSVYTYPDSDGAKLEAGLGTQLNILKLKSRQRQAGHYDRYTNIGAGMHTARVEIESKARPKAFRMMILITDGQANRTSTAASPSQFALDEAYLAKASQIKIMTISLGANADTGLMQQIADITGGEHFNVPGGEGVAAYEEDLKSIFGQIASDRPLKLIHEN